MPASVASVASVAAKSALPPPPPLPRLGLGGAPLGGLFRGAVSAKQGEELMRAAWRAGIRLFDTAPLYGFGASERIMGDFLRGRPRDEFILSTKAGRLLAPATGRHPERANFKTPMPFEPAFDYSYDGVMRSFEHSTHRLGLDRIDILLMHDIGRATHGARAHPGLMKTAMRGGFRAMDELRRAGVVRAVGLGVNEWEVCEEAMERGRFDCFLLAGRYTLLEQESLNSFLPKCVRAGVKVLVGGAFNSGALVGRGRYNYRPAPPEIRRRVARLRKACAARGVNLAAAALQFPPAHPAVASVLIGARNAAELRQNLALFKTPIPVQLWDDLKSAGLLHPDAPTPARPARPAGRKRRAN